MSKNNIVILDDHPVFFIGLKNIIHHNSFFTVTDCCKDSKELFFSLSLAPANIALIDCSRPNEDMDLVSVVEHLHHQHPTMAIITMGDCHDHRQQSDDLRPQVFTHFSKTLAADNWITSLHTAWLKHSLTSYSAGHDTGREKRKVPARLSVKEQTVIEYIHAGMTVSQIAQKLSRSVKTISAQKRNAMRKMGVDRDSDLFRININKTIRRSN